MGALIQDNWCPYKEETSGHRDRPIQKQDTEEEGHLQAKDTLEHRSRERPGTHPPSSPQKEPDSGPQPVRPRISKV